MSYINVVSYNIGTFISQGLAKGSEKHFIQEKCIDEKCIYNCKPTLKCYNNSITLINQLLITKTDIIGLQEFRFNNPDDNDLNYNNFTNNINKSVFENNIFEYVVFINLKI